MNAALVLSKSLKILSTPIFLLLLFSISHQNTNGFQWRKVGGGLSRCSNSIFQQGLMGAEPTSKTLTPWIHNIPSLSRLRQCSSPPQQPSFNYARIRHWRRKKNTSPFFLFSCYLCINGSGELVISVSHLLKRCIWPNLSHHRFS